MTPPRLDAPQTRSRADALLRRRSDVTPDVVEAELAAADVSELRRWLLVKLRADDLEPEDPPRLALIAKRAGLGPARRDVEAVALNAARPEIARRAALTVLEACDAGASRAVREKLGEG